PDKLVFVVGHGADDVRDEVSSWGLTPKPVFVEQREQLGTGHAVRVAERSVGRVDDVLVANGDLDPVLPDDVRALVRHHRRVAAAARIARTERTYPGTCARIVGEGRGVVGVIEGRAAPADVRRISEVGTNWIAFRRQPLFATLPRVDRRNRLKEYY